LIDRYFLDPPKDWEYDAEYISSVIEAFKFEKDDPNTGHRRVDSVRWGVYYGMDAEHLAKKHDAPISEIKFMISVLQQSNRIPKQEYSDA